MRPDQAAEKLTKSLVYILSRVPDEFGLVPDAEGFVPVKELLKALAEEEGFRHVREGHINAALVQSKEPRLAIAEGRIKALDWDGSFHKGPVRDLPKLLYTTVRDRAHSVALEHGARPGAMPFVVLAAEKEMALRIGRRSGLNPVLLTVNTAQAKALGVVFDQRGAMLYTAPDLPPGSFSAPPLPKERPGKETREKKPEQKEEPVWGGFLMDLSLRQGKAPGEKSKGGRKKKGWKEEARRTRREKGEI
jgi:putative RNA 2'-phosphotransferase